ncbi:MAG TPA: DCC1-like thiol-disulfide oxidoreductase family protein [Terriglobales bacterium]|jgi:predicted DCC family thiol-disulfide oxidoreductase YuxK|nr:DCC1-like thiol-disulfide oxidoreductase family protein [Terriglobales bacterium]
MAEHPIILYDGVCGLCNRFVQFVLRHDRRGLFRFAALQSVFGQAALIRGGLEAANVKTVYVIVPSEGGERCLSKSEAALFVMKELGGLWGVLASLSRFFPRSVRDWTYDLVARNRYRIFGRYETCPVPSPEVRSRFLDQP